MFQRSVYLILVSYTVFCSILLNSFFLTYRHFELVVFALGGLVGLAISIDLYSSEMNANLSKYWGIRYAVPAYFAPITLIVAPIYLIDRTRISRQEVPYVSSTWVRSIITSPWSIVRSLYAGCGIIVAVFFISFMLFVPLVVSPGFDGLSNSPIGFLPYLAIILTFTCFGMVSDSTRNSLTYFFRDVSIRILPIIGFTVISTVLIMILLFPVAFILAIYGVVFNRGLEVLLPISQGMLYPLLLIPLSIVVVLLIRLLPWIQVIPLLIYDSLRSLQKFISKWFSEGNIIDISVDKTHVIPVAGHHHTDISLPGRSEFEWHGSYGYIPTPIQEVSVDDLPSSLWLGLIGLIPGYIVGSIIFWALFSIPETVEDIAVMLPVEDILFRSLSTIGLPLPVVESSLAILRLPPDILSVGFIGGLLPAVLMIVGAWHLALEYEAFLYQLHKRLGDGNHLLTLWLGHFIPVIPLYGLFRPIFGYCYRVFQKYL